MEEKIFIPIDDAIEAFRHHLDVHDRTILSARFGDGKSFFLSHFMENEDVAERYTFLTIFPVNYQVTENRDIFELIKRDILLQMLLKGVMVPDVEISNEVAFALYLQNNPLGFTESFLPLLSEYLLSGNAEKIAFFASSFNKFFKNITNKLDDVKKLSRDDQLDRFLSAVEQDSVVGQDAISSIIQQGLQQYKDNNPEKQVVLVIEDLDRIDPAHLFRILNIFSAHIDFCYRFGCAPDKSLAGNKFGLDKVVFVMHYENVKNIYSHFYGAETNFEGYIEKFCSSNHFTYSLQEQRDSYFLKQIEIITGIGTNILNFIIKPADITAKTLRKVVNAFDNVDKSVIKVIKVKNFEGHTIPLHSGMLKLIVILKKIGFEDSEIVSRFKHAIETKGIISTDLFSYFAPYLNLAQYGNVRGSIRFISSTNRTNTFQVNHFLNDGKAYCDYFIMTNEDDNVEKDLLKNLNKILTFVAK